jgi:hypothetical protein
VSCWKTRVDKDSRGDKNFEMGKDYEKDVEKAWERLTNIQKGKFVARAANELKLQRAAKRAAAAEEEISEVKFIFWV